MWRLSLWFTHLAEKVKLTSCRNVPLIIRFTLAFCLTGGSYLFRGTLSNSWLKLLVTFSSQFTDIVSRDNCATNLYCTSDTLVCAPRFAAGIPCKSDSQCLSGNCDLNNRCVNPPETPSAVPKFVYVIVPLFILIGLAVMTYSLWKYHQKARKRRNETLYEYWMEQLAYRRSIINMQLAAEREQRKALLHKTESSTRIGLQEKSGWYTEKAAFSNDVKMLL